MWNRIHSVKDIIFFTLTVLSRPRWHWLALSAFLTLAGLYFLIADMYAQAWLSLCVAIIGGLKSVVSVAWRWIRSPALSFKSAANFNHFVTEVALDDAYQRRGYRIEYGVHDDGEPVIRSRSIDAWLQSNRFSVTDTSNEAHRDKLNQILASDSGRHEDILRCAHRISARADPPREFLNEAKTCLASDLLDPNHTIEVFQGSYFHSFLTNEVVSWVLYSRGRHPRVLFQGSDHYPAYPANNNSRQLKHIRDSGMSNHIGVSTIAHTSDNTLVLWRQGEGAQQSREYLAPTGSGSCDWSDWQAVRGDQLNAVLVYGMSRELREESMLSDHIGIETRVIGYFRWVRRGGKPEFLGVSKVAASSSQLQPDTLEVDDPLALRTAYPAGSLDELTQSIKLLLDMPNLSVPLRVNLQCLRDAVIDMPDAWCRFLGINP